MESILQQQLTQILGTDTQSAVSITATEPPALPDKCQLQSDALRGAMVDCKAAMKRLQECQEAWFQCRQGKSIYNTLELRMRYESIDTSLAFLEIYTRRTEAGA